jgi:tetratricopeptide (TPR) repeat protein
MTYPQAREGFEAVTRTDPHCAMAHWGVAMTLFQPLWPTRPSPADLQHGWEEVQKANALAPPTEPERLLIEAAGAFFLEPASTDYWARIGRWEKAMQRAYTAFPDDPEITAFYALSHLAAATTAPAVKTNSDEAATLLLRVYAKNPDHPGAMHYLVHANDVAGRENQSLAITRKYDEIAPDNPHALHMPTHIYTRLGEWDASISGNLRAAEAALHSRAGDRGQYVWDEFAHAEEYLIYAYLQQGKDDRALEQLQRLRNTSPQIEPTFKLAFHVASTQARYALERHAWTEAIAIAPREPSTLAWDNFAWPEAIARFARGAGAAHVGKLDMAQAEAEQLVALQSKMLTANEQLFARNIQVLALELGAWIAHARGQAESSLALMNQAAALEVATPKHPVTPAPTIPAHEQLGDLLIELKQPAEALPAYQRSLELYPHRFNSLVGAARAAQASGSETLARSYYAELMKVADGSMRQSILREARQSATRLN